ncbi:MOSC domain-containing protein [Caulobacter sp. NIBR2454]|uniref:MOSC domain-containing protein n=1 Tax=Caulobacter sp. NIBR2454 TaxID=3015996 RepID=UPI0022B5E67A|nr:MOSC domain-containing protein [Caulobacter sp. NIBR2454]
MSPRHRFSKAPAMMIRLIAGIGVEGDAHAGLKVQHRSRARFNPTLPNLRQVHLIQAELLDELNEQGFSIGPGDIGENVTTRGLDLLALPTGTILRLGEEAELELTGLRNPCIQMDRFQDGLMAATLGHDEQGGLIRKAGVMAIVLNGGVVTPGDPVAATHPAAPHRPLKPV